MTKILPTDARLFSPYDWHGLTLKNRVAMAPLTRGRADETRIPNALMRQYYTQRAGAGLIITEATSISRQGVGWVNSPGMFTDAQADGWRSVVNAVHEAGGRIVLQLWHCGRASHTSFHPELGLPVAPSAVAITGDGIHTPVGKQAYETPRALETSEIPAIVNDYRQAAERARHAGFDGVEIHAANGYLIDQFLQSVTNQRTDRYGGTMENQCRFLLEVTDAVCQVWPARRVGVRLSPNGGFNDMGCLEYRELFLHAAGQLAKRPLGYLHVMDGTGFPTHQLGAPLTLVDIQTVYPHPLTLMGNVGYTAESAETALQEGHADLIAFGRPFITNPDLVDRFQHGWPLTPFDDPTPWYGGGETGYTDFPIYPAMQGHLSAAGV